MRLVRAISRVSTPVQSPCAASRTWSSITISSSDALPARSPMPLIAHSTWRQPGPQARERVGHRNAEVVVAVHGRGHVGQPGHEPVQPRHISAYSSGIV